MAIRIITNRKSQTGRSSRSEGTAAPARLLGVRIVEDESFRQQRRVVVEDRPLQEQIALAVDEDPGAVPLEHLVPEARVLFPGKGVAQSRAPAALDAHAQTTFADALLRHQRLDL